MTTQRLPLFADGGFAGVGAGAPQPTVDDTTILDLRGLSVELASYTRFIHLWLARGQAGAATVSCKIEEGTNPSQQITASESSVVINPIKLLDGFPLRGNVRLSITSDAAAGVIYGYYAMEPTLDYAGRRPLQPSGSLVTPFSYVPQSVNFNAGDPGPKVIHSVDEAFIDTLTVDISARDGGIGPLLTFIDPTAGVVSAPIRVTPVNNVRVFDGIPVRGLGNLTLNATEADVEGSAYGTFRRS